MRIEIGRCIDYGFRLISLDLYFHRHGFIVNKGFAGKGDRPMHFHFMLSFAWWYAELSIGKEDPDA